MPWLPTFLNPWPAIIAAAVVIPTLLLLYFLKLRRQELPIASTLLWKKAIEDLQVNAPFQRLRKNLLLILQLLLLIVLLMALARPVTFFTPGAGKATVIIIDRSASMSAADIGGRTRLDEAKRRAKALLDTLDRGSTAMVIAFDDRAEVVWPWTSDTAALRSAIDSIQPTNRKSRLKQAYQLAEAQASLNPDRPATTSQPPDVYVFSDGRVLDAAELSINANLKYEKIGTDQAGNIAIVSLNARRNYQRPTEVQVFARLANFGPQPATADVELWVSAIDPTEPDKDRFVNRGAAVVRLPPQRWDETTRAQAEQAGEEFTDAVLFDLELPTGAVIRLEHKNRTQDVLPADDIAQIVLPPPRLLDVLCVTDGNWYMQNLMQALAAAGVHKPVIMSPAEYDKKLPGNFDVIIFDRRRPQHLPPSGNFVYLGCVGPGLKITPVQENGLDVVLTDVEVADWNRDHPILRDISMARIFASQAMKLNLPPEAEILVESTRGPLMVLYRQPHSLHLVIAFDPLQSNWPLRPQFPVFWYYALQYMALGGELGALQSFEPGATPRIPLANLQRAGSNPRQIRLIGPDGRQDLTIPGAGDFALPPLEATGVYRLDPIVPQYERLAVNLLDENESNLLPLDNPPGNIGTALATAGKTRLELWWWLVACGAIPLLLLEWWVYTRRVHL